MQTREGIMRFIYFKRALLGFALLFALLFVSRAVYDLTVAGGDDVADNYNVYYPAEKGGKMTSNIASYRMPAAAGEIAAPALEQKYERIANIVAKTVSYDSDMRRFDETLKAQNAVVQMENRRGLTGSRRVDLTIGVRPENFEAMREELSQIGKIISTNTTSTDKTYEYRMMLAEKETLERRRSSYEELRKYGSSIPDLLQLEEKIIEVESQIQQQQIGLGEYSDENALCTINYTLYEGTEAGLPRKLWNALIWSVGVYMAIVGVLMFTALAAVALVWCWTKLRKLLSEKPAPAYTPAPAPTSAADVKDKPEE